MKKLLALLLCVMLFVSVIPTSAFAAVDLSDAYAAQNNLYVAYAQLGAATAIKNGILGIRGLENADNKAYLESGPMSPIKTLIAMLQLVSMPWSVPHGLSYEGLVKVVGSAVNYAYNMAGQVAADSTATAIGKTVTDVNTSVTNIINSFAPQGGSTVI